MLLGQNERASITTRQQFFLALFPIAPNRADSMDDPFGREAIPFCNLRLASRAPAQLAALLQQHAQKSMNATPVYELLDEKGPDHSKCFEVCVQIDGKRFESAWGPNKKMAEQKAALLALEELGLMDSKDIDDALEDIEEELKEEDK